MLQDRRLLDTLLLSAFLAVATVQAGCGRNDGPIDERRQSRHTSVWVAFAVGGTEILPESAAELRRALPRSGAGAPIVVMGYAHESDDLKYNLELAEVRARAIARHLNDLGVVQERIRIGAAELSPADDHGVRAEVRFVQDAVVR